MRCFDIAGVHTTKLIARFYSTRARSIKASLDTIGWNVRVNRVSRGIADVYFDIWDFLSSSIRLSRNSGERIAATVNSWKVARFVRVWQFEDDDPSADLENIVKNFESDISFIRGENSSKDYRNTQTSSPFDYILHAQTRKRILL